MLLLQLTLVVIVGMKTLGTLFRMLYSVTSLLLKSLQIRYNLYSKRSNLHLSSGIFYIYYTQLCWQVNINWPTWLVSLEWFHDIWYLQMPVNNDQNISSLRKLVCYSLHLHSKFNSKSQSAVGLTVSMATCAPLPCAMSVSRRTASLVLQSPSITLVYPSLRARSIKIFCLPNSI